MKKINLLILIITLLISSFVFGISVQVKWHKKLDRLEFNQNESGRWARVMMHMHSVFSHDACDNKPMEVKENGEIKVNKDCLKDFKKAQCDHHVDAVFLTEHRKYFSEYAFQKIIQAYDLDQYRVERAMFTGGVINCDDNHQVEVIPGSENRLMTFGLKKHPERKKGWEMEWIYDAIDAENIEIFRRTGAIVGAPHMEKDKYTLELLKMIKPEAVEMYNLHANIKSVFVDKNIWKITNFIRHTLGFIFNPLIQTDLWMLVFLELDEKKTLTKWAQLVMHQKTTGIVGSDIHQNILPIKMKDGERLGGYLRMGRWFSNYVYLPSGNLNRDNLISSIVDGRVLGVFEILGIPKDFEFYIETENGEFPMGSEIAFKEGMLIRVKRPSNSPDYTYISLLKATDNGWKLVKQSKQRKLTFYVKEKGVYRVQINVKALHLWKFMYTKYNIANKVFPWVMSNPIYLR